MILVVRVVVVCGAYMSSARFVLWHFCTLSHAFSLCWQDRMRFTVLPALMLAAAPAATAFAPGAGFNLAKMGAPAVAQPRAISVSARRPARLLDLKATAAYPLQETITGGPRGEADYTVPEWRKKVDLKAWAAEVRAVEKKYRAQQSVEEDVAHMKKMLNWTYILYAVGEFQPPLFIVTLVS